MNSMKIDSKRVAVAIADSFHKMNTLVRDFANVHDRPLTRNISIVVYDLIEAEVHIQSVKT